MPGRWSFDVRNATRQTCPVLTIVQCGPLGFCKKWDVWKASHRMLQWRSVKSERSGHIALLWMYITCWLLFRLGVPFVIDTIEKENYFCPGSGDVECAAQRLLTMPFFCCFPLYIAHLFLIVLYFCTFFSLLTLAYEIPYFKTTLITSWRALA